MRLSYFLSAAALVIASSIREHTTCSGGRLAPNVQQFQGSDGTQKVLYAEAECDENPHEPHDGFIHFEDFLEQVHGAKFEHYSDGAVESAEAFEEMRSHILTMYDSVGEVTHSFYLEFVYVDCIEVKRQPSVRILGLDTIETAPHRITRPGGDKGGDGRDSRKNVRSPLELGLTNPFGNAISCPEDTIPFSRITFEGVTSFATLKGFFSKSPDGDLPDAGTHQYAFSYQNVINYGSGAGLKTVEGVWIVYPIHFNNTKKPVLFVYSTPDNYGSNRSCYNLECPGFVQMNSKWVLGSPLGPVSVMGGTQYGVVMLWKMAGGTWWLQLQSEKETFNVGYYPAGFFNGGPLTSNAVDIKYGGEVYKNSPEVDWPQMGSSVLPSGGLGYSAFQDGIMYMETSCGDATQANLRGVVIGSRSCWSIAMEYPGDQFYFGGPGGRVCT